MGETRGGRVGGFPEPERAVRGAPEALRVLRGKSCLRGKTTHQTAQPSGLPEDTRYINKITSK